MATINLGSIKFNWKGTYAGGTAYVVDDVVSYNGSSYICKLASTGNLPTNTTYWDQMSSAGTNGTDGTDLTTTLTTQGDLIYRDGSGLQRLGAGTSGQVLQTGGTGANPSWGTVSSDYVKLATVTANGSASSVSLDGYFSSTYKNYEVHAYNVKSSSNSRAIWRFNLSGSADTSGNYYQAGRQAYTNSGGSSSAGNPREWAGTSFQFTHNTDDNASAPHHSVIKIFDPLNASYLTQGFAQAIGMNSTQHDHYVYGFLFNQTTAPSGMTFVSSGGNITGEFTLYGLKV
jgi:hypothetical protein